MVSRPEAREQDDAGVVRETARKVARPQGRQKREGRGVDVAFDREAVSLGTRSGKSREPQHGKPLAVDARSVRIARTSRNGSTQSSAGTMTATGGRVPRMPFHRACFDRGVPQSLERFCEPADAAGAAGSGPDEAGVLGYHGVHTGRS